MLCFNWARLLMTLKLYEVLKPISISSRVAKFVWLFKKTNGLLSINRSIDSVDFIHLFVNCARAEPVRFACLSCPWFSPKDTTCVCVSNCFCTVLITCNQVLKSFWSLCVIDSFFLTVQSTVLCYTNAWNERIFGHFRNGSIVNKTPLRNCLAISLMVLATAMTIIARQDR